MTKNRLEIAGVIILFGILSLISTYPLIQHFYDGIPYDSISGVKAWNRSGDQLQLLYWFWLVKENILGTVPFDTNPFEFNMTSPHDTTGFATSPLALLFFLFSPLGDIAAYNCTILTTYVLAGTFMYLLVKLYTGSRMGALLGAIIFTFGPSRINGVTGGNMYGMLYFLYPWILYFLEKGIRAQKLGYGVLAGLGMLCLSMLEAHLLYYLCIFLAAYIPLRVVMVSSRDDMPLLLPIVEIHGRSNWSAYGSLLLIFGSGFVATIYSQLLFTFRDQTPFVSKITVWILLLYPLIPVVLAIFLASLYRLLFSIELREALTIEAKSFLPVFLLIPVSFFIINGSAFETATLVTVIGISIVLLKFVFLREHLMSLFVMLTRGVILRSAGLVPITPVLLVIGYIVFWLPMSKQNKFEATIAAAGRTLQDVKLYSAKLMDAVTPESNVYIGIVTALIVATFLFTKIFSVTRKGDSATIDCTNNVFSAFYLCVALISFPLAMGLAFGKSSLYLLLYYYLPYFNYPRVSDRIIILTLFSAAVLAGYLVRQLQQNSSQPWRFFVHLLLLVAIAGQLKDFHFFRPTGINILDRGQDIYTHIQENIGDGVLLEIPLWPGDSHQSSLYQYYVMQDRIPRVNGYSPLVRNDYLNSVFKPLAGMNKGRIGKQQWKILLELDVKYVTVHNNNDIFPKKVSPFGPITTVRRFIGSPFLELVDIDNTMYFRDFSKKNRKLYLFRVKNPTEVNAIEEHDSWYAMPFYYYAGYRLHRQVGEVVQDTNTGRKVFRAIAGKHQPGFLVYGPYAYYTPGKYRSYFELQTNSLLNAYSQEQDGATDLRTDRGIARIEVVYVATDGTLSILAQKEIEDNGDRGGNRREFLDFQLDEFGKLEFRVYFYGYGSVVVKEIMIYPQQHDKPRYFLAAEKMVGETGEIVESSASTTGKVVEAVVKRNKKGAMVYGPNAIYPEGRYKARYYLKLKNKTRTNSKDARAAAAVISVTHGIEKETIVTRDIYTVDLTTDSFGEFELDFSLPNEQDLSFPVTFTGKANIQLDRIIVEKLTE